MSFRKRGEPGGWWLPTVLLLAVAAGLAIGLAGPHPLGVILGMALVVVPIGWVLVSALWPAEARRTCPGCGQESLERLDPGSTHGLVCRSCDWRDESASAWLLAEEEGPLEDLVLAQRGRRPVAGVPPVVDSPEREG